jgi:rfaE bifunctional protein nucleotidyltransferase chain/domain
VTSENKLFADASNFALRFVPDYQRLGQMADSLRDLHQTVVLTSGSFDILHEGHSLYLEAARGFGDFLIVGVDSDEKVRRRKGSNRPAVPELERLRMVTHQRGVGLVTLKPADEPKWSLIQAVRPDVLVATAETYTPEEIRELEATCCGRVEVLDRMATVTTSARLRSLQLGLSDDQAARRRSGQDGGGAGRRRKQVLLYLPVVHAGYERLLERHRDADEILLLGSSVIANFPVLAKEIRALTPERAAAYLSAAGPVGPAVRVVEVQDLPDAVDAEVLVVPDEDVLRTTVADHRLGERAEVAFEQTFLRWDREWSRLQRPAGYDEVATVGDTERQFARLSSALAARSSDWWRQVGAVAVRKDTVLYEAHNSHRPTEYAPYLNGDPRNNFKRGIEIELSTAMHAEAAIVARAAREAVSLEGADLYVSTFPCPVCARLVAETGFARCFFAGPYAMLDGEEVLRAAGVELVWVDLAGDATDEEPASAG